jgi:NitT/TauT family transport system ATP-binding protein
MAFLSVNNVCKSFRMNDGGLLAAVSNLTMSVGEGEFVSLFGPNGCGKSTLLFLISGVEQPNSGIITLRGLPVQNSRVGMVFQNYRDALLPWRSNLSNLCLPLELERIPPTERRQRGLALAESLGIQIDMCSYPYQLSGGQQQLLSLARALVSGPDLLLLDEPLSSLDFQTRLRMADEIQEIWQRTAITTVLVSHDIDDAIYLSDRICFLSERPAAICRELPVSLSRPRTASARTSKVFFDLRNQSLEIFREIIAND